MESKLQGRNMPRKIIVTSALPYANGPIHLGHLVEYLQTDIWVRFQKLCGNECLYFCADDTHGTPVMISARTIGISPEELIEKVHKEHKEDFDGFHVEFDNYYSTHSPENKHFSELIFNRLNEAARKLLNIRHGILHLNSCSAGGHYDQPGRKNGGMPHSGAVSSHKHPEK